MSKRIEELAEALGAEIVGELPFEPVGFAALALPELVRGRLRPGQGKRPGRPSDPRWTKRSKVPLAPETEARLQRIAAELSDERRKVSPMQVAAVLLEEATAKYFER